MQDLCIAKLLLSVSSQCLLRRWNFSKSIIELVAKGADRVPLHSKVRIFRLCGNRRLNQFLKVCTAGTKVLSKG